MKNFAFISRHEPTQSQHDIARQRGVALHHVGDRDGFTVRWQEFAAYDGVVVVHPAMASRLLTPINHVGVFANANRAAVGEPPRFEVTALHVYRLVDNQICEVQNETV